MSLQAAGRRPRLSAASFFLPKFPADESAQRSPNGKFLAKWRLAFGRTWETRFASAPRDKSAMRLAESFLSTPGSNGSGRKETNFRGAGRGVLRTGKLPLPMG